VWHGGSDVIFGPSILAYGGGMAVAYKNGISKSILAYGWHGGRVQEWYKSIYFGVRGGMEAEMF
jgi:hypothetical protein